ncbi:MAG: response regulator [Cytophagaceae bacterium]|jgi:two-component system LytT family response regulator|nr:response regulator [Cytophagaceae bacterium]
MKKVVIIDDEAPARALIRHFLSEVKEFEIIAECQDGFEAIKVIQEQKPDLIFLDVQMPRLTGFEVLELISPQPEIIFSTAYDNYAIKAFEANAIDYLLKPYTQERFNTAIEKAKERLKNKNDSAASIQIEGSEQLERIAVRTGNKIKVIPNHEIFYLESDGDYVRIHTQEGVFLKEKTMKYYEANLAGKNFIRIHRSYLLNVTFLDRLEMYDKDSYLAILKNGEKLKTSANGYKSLRERLSL